MLIKNGKLVDKSMGYAFVKRDIRIEDGVIKEIGENLKQNENEEILYIEGNIITPGFIDIHTHVYHGKTVIGIDPDKVGVELGVTSVIDAGTSGADTFEDFYNRIIKNSKTRVFAFLNIASTGLETLHDRLRRHAGGFHALLAETATTAGESVDLPRDLSRFENHRGGDSCAGGALVLSGGDRDA